MDPSHFSDPDVAQIVHNMEKERTDENPLTAHESQAVEDLLRRIENGTMDEESPSGTKTGNSSEIQTHPHSNATPTKIAANHDANGLSRSPFATHVVDISGTSRVDAPNGDETFGSNGRTPTTHSKSGLNGNNTDSTDGSQKPTEVRKNESSPTTTTTPKSSSENASPATSKVAPSSTSSNPANSEAPSKPTKPLSAKASAPKPWKLKSRSTSPQKDVIFGMEELPVVDTPALKDTTSTSASDTTASNGTTTTFMGAPAAPKPHNSEAVAAQDSPADRKPAAPKSIEALEDAFKALSANQKNLPSKPIDTPTETPKPSTAIDKRPTVPPLAVNTTNANVTPANAAPVPRSIEALEETYKALSALKEPTPGRKGSTPDPLKSVTPRKTDPLETDIVSPRGSKSSTPTKHMDLTKSRDEGSPKPAPRKQSVTPRKSDDDGHVVSARSQPSTTPRKITTNDENAAVYTKADMERLRQEVTVQISEEFRIVGAENIEFAGRLEEEMRGNRKMRNVLIEYEKTINRLIENKASEKDSIMRDRVVSLEAENSRITNDLTAMQQTFADLKSRYEDAKALNERLKANENVLVESNDKMQSEILLHSSKFSSLKAYAEQRLDAALDQMAALRESSQKDVSVANVKLQKAESRVKTLEADIDNKAKENKELTSICEELIAKLEAQKPVSG